MAARLRRARIDCSTSEVFMGIQKVNQAVTVKARLKFTDIRTKDIKKAEPFNTAPLEIWFLGQAGYCFTWEM